MHIRTEFTACTNSSETKAYSGFECGKNETYFVILLIIRPHHYVLQMLSLLFNIATHDTLSICPLLEAE
jgi:hypothetical protein